MIMVGQWKVPLLLVLMRNRNRSRCILRSCEIYANESDVADQQVVSIGDETRAHKKLQPVKMYWRSREIFEIECMEADTRNTLIVDVSDEDPLDVNTEGDDGPVWDEAPEFSLKTRHSDCVSVNMWDRDPVDEDPGGLYESGCSDRLCGGPRG